MSIVVCRASAPLVAVGISTAPAIRQQAKAMPASVAPVSSAVGGPGDAAMTCEQLKAEGMKPQAALQEEAENGRMADSGKAPAQSAAAVGAAIKIAEAAAGRAGVHGAGAAATAANIGVAAQVAVRAEMKGKLLHLTKHIDLALTKGGSRTSNA